MIQCYSCGGRFPELSRDDAHGAGVYEAVEPDEPGRAILICTQCLENGGFDLWTDQSEWDSHSPKVRYAQIPPMDHDSPRWDDATNYPSADELLAG